MGTWPEMPRLQPSGDAELTEEGVVRLELGSGTTLGQGAFREGPPEGKAGQGCARPVADMTRSAVEHRSPSICLLSWPVSCCEGSPGPTESNAPEVGFSSEPGLISLSGRGAFRPSDDTRRVAEMSDAWSCT